MTKDAADGRPSLAVPLGWQPIDSAPKDGSAILSIVGDKIPVVCWWCKGDYYSGWWRGDAGYRIYPTHWMPLPDPPAVPLASRRREQEEKGNDG